jgi:phosphoribosyl-ATP pyrophosphohydrolase
MVNRQVRKKKSKKAPKDRSQEHLLEQLYAQIDAHKDGDHGRSDAARLFKRGREQIAKKLGEEAVETLIEGIRGDRLRLVLESADLLYHLLALWSANKVRPKMVWSELAHRSGLSERKSRT